MMNNRPVFGRQAAIVFPGQGTQRKGMGEDFYKTFSAARLVYEEASDILGWDVSAMCFDGDARLDLTEFAQPCILTTEMAMYRSLQEEYALSAGCFGGHSLGEYTALTAAGAIPLADAVRVVQQRGRLMRQASPSGKGAMMAVIAEDLDEGMIQRAVDPLPVDVANVNSPAQIVLSGRSEDMPRAESRVRQIMDREPRFVRLNVGAPFHSRFMAGIREPFQAVLEEHLAGIRSGQAASRVTSNFTGDFYEDDRQKMIDSLVDQVSGTVLWRRNMEVLAKEAGPIYEIGPGRPLRSFFSCLNLDCRSITTARSAEKTLGVKSLSV